MCRLVHLLTLLHGTRGKLYGSGAEGLPLGGCKENLESDNPNAEMVCKTECELGSIGRDNAINFRWMINTERNLAGLITVQNKKLGYPAADEPYIGIIRLEKKYCGSQLLHQIEANGHIQFDAGDKTNPNHWLESITYAHSVGEKWQKTALFIQFRRGLKATV